MTIVCLGDSNTWGYDPKSYWGSRYDIPWPDQLARLAGWNIIDAGKNGREIPCGKQEYQIINKTLSESAADLLIVMLGTNDLLQGASAEIAAARMEAFLTQLPAERAHILLIAPPKMQLGEWVQSQNLIGESEALAGRYQQLAQRLGIRFADSGKWSINLTFDGVHFTEEGHERFANKLKTYIELAFSIPFCR